MFDPFYESAVRKYGSNPSFGYSFMILSKSDASRYELVAPLLQNLPFLKVPDSANTKKNDKMSVAAREDGNNYFKSGCYTSALKAYTKSLAFAPPDSIAFSLALANRSAVLKKIDNLLECVDDIQQALENKYPSNLKYKLHQRNAECLMQLNRFNEALLSFEKAIACLADAKLASTDEKKITQTIEEGVKICNDKKTIITLASLSLSESRMNTSTNKDNMLLLSNGTHPQYPCAANCLVLKYNEEIGRHFEATEDLEPGATLMVETATAGCLFTDNFYTHCSYCMHRCVRLLPCKECTWAMYCSMECLTADAQSHKIECALVPTLLAWDMGEISMLLVKIVAKYGITKISEFLSTTDAKVNEPLKKGFKNGQYQSTDFNAIYHLDGNSKLRGISDLFKRVVTAWCLVKCFGNLLPDPTVFGGLFLRLLQSLAVNSTTVDEVITNFQGVEQNFEVGGALFPTHSMLTHSCQPNLSEVDDGITKIIYVLQPVKKGSILTNSYGWTFVRHPKAYRQERCLSRHQFSCKCLACEENWPLGLGAWSHLPFTYHDKKHRKLCEQSVSNIKDLWNLVRIDKEISAEDAARICKHIKVLSEAGATKCTNYWLHIKSLENFFARKGTRYVQKYP